MERKIRTSTLVISAIGIVCIIYILAANLVFGFYFGPEKQAYMAPNLIIENDRGYKNTLPNWFYAGDGNYKLVFAVNVPEPMDDYSIEGNPSWNKTSMMIAVLDPFKKEMYNGKTKAYVINNQGEIESEVFDLLKSAPHQPYRKLENQ